MNLPTVDPADPYRLTEEEEEVMIALESSIVNSEKLQKEIDSYMEVIRGITLYLLSVDVKYCPQEGDSGKF